MSTKTQTQTLEQQIINQLKTLKAFCQKCGRELTRAIYTKRRKGSDEVEIVCNFYCEHCDFKDYVIKKIYRIGNITVKINSTSTQVNVDWASVENWLMELETKYSKRGKKKEEVKAKLKVEVKEERKIVPLRGFLVDFDLPSTAILNATFDLFYENRKIGKEVIKLTTKYFYNKLKNISRDLYTKLNEFAIKTPFGYVVALSDIEKLYTLKEKIREKIEEFDQELRDFIKHGKLPQHLVEYLERRGVLDEYLTELQEHRKIVEKFLREKGESFESLAEKIPPLVERFRCKVTPISINFDDIINLVPEKAREVAMRLVEETAMKIKEETEKKLREEAEAKVQELIQWINTNIQNIKKSLLEGRLKSAKEYIEKIVRKGHDLGIDVKPIREIVNKIENAIKTVESSSDELVDTFRLKQVLERLTK